MAIPKAIAGQRGSGMPVMLQIASGISPDKSGERQDSRK